jgi:hypothetical protein
MFFVFYAMVDITVIMMSSSYWYFFSYIFYIIKYIQITVNIKMHVNLSLCLFFKVVYFVRINVYQNYKKEPQNLVRLLLQIFKIWSKMIKFIFSLCKKKETDSRPSGRLLNFSDRHMFKIRDFNCLTHKVYRVFIVHCTGCTLCSWTLDRLPQPSPIRPSLYYRKHL